MKGGVICWTGSVSELLPMGCQSTVWKIRLEVGGVCVPERASRRVRIVIYRIMRREIIECR